MLAWLAGRVDEEVLVGGFVTDVVRVGDTVRRPPGSRPAFVRELLGLLQRRGFAGAPRFRGVDEQGRDVLDFVPGHVAWRQDQPVEVTGDASLARIAELVRELHDATAGSGLAGANEVVCHNDLLAKDTVYRDGGAGLRPVAFIDWDIAAPGSRVSDVAHVCWQYIGLGPDCGDVADAVRLVCDAYGLVDRGSIVETIMWWQDRCRRGIEAEAAAGDPAKTALREAGVCEETRAAYWWVANHGYELNRALG